MEEIQERIGNIIAQGLREIKIDDGELLDRLTDEAVEVLCGQCEEIIDEDENLHDVDFATIMSCASDLLNIITFLIQGDAIISMISQRNNDGVINRTIQSFRDAGFIIDRNTIKIICQDITNRFNELLRNNR